MVFHVYYFGISFCAVLPSARAAHFIIRMFLFPIFEARNLVLIASVPGHC